MTELADLVLSSRWESDRPRRSSFQTTRQSPDLRKASAFARPIRSSRPPLARSSNRCRSSTPAASRPRLTGGDVQRRSSCLADVASSFSADFALAWLQRNRSNDRAPSCIAIPVTLSLVQRLLCGRCHRLCVYLDIPCAISTSVHSYASGTIGKNPIDNLIPPCRRPKVEKSP